MRCFARACAGTAGAHGGGFPWHILPGGGAKLVVYALIAVLVVWAWARLRDSNS